MVDFPKVCFQIVWSEVGLDATKIFTLFTIVEQNRPYRAGNQFFSVIPLIQ